MGVPEIHGSRDSVTHSYVVGQEPGAVGPACESPREEGASCTVFVKLFVMVHRGEDQQAGCGRVVVLHPVPMVARST